MELDWSNAINIGSVPFTHTFDKAGEVIFSATGTIGGTYLYLRINNYTTILSYNTDNDSGAGSSQSYIVSAGDTMQVWASGSGYNSGSNVAKFIPFK